MTQDILEPDIRESELGQEEVCSRPPLCLVHYFGATGQGPPPPNAGYIAEREENLLVLEFCPPPKPERIKQKRPVKAGDVLTLLLLLVSLLACIAAFRF